ncbi:MAG TPA: DUF2442 domain-containing protein [Polyangia bacterium]|jgi:Protein of unknown function (DUF2442).|nr:DUF2442 domain-containing protein [Polyangia bacterium]
MTKITRARHGEALTIELWFSDDTTGTYDMAPIIARDTVLTRPLRDPAYLRSFYLELGALAWPNGLELSPAAIHAALHESGRLQALPRLAHGG